jgi:hypothetical protein
MERAAKHGKPLPISVEQAYLELTDPELAQATKQTKSKVFPCTAAWPIVESPKRQQRFKSAHPQKNSI